MGAGAQQLEVRREPEVKHRWMRGLTLQTQNKKQIEEAVAPPPCNLKQMLFSEERTGEWHADGGGDSLMYGARCPLPDVVQD